MNILVIHKYYWHRDGASNYALDSAEALRAAGHTVVPFAMHDERNEPSAWSRFFVSSRDLAHPDKASVWQKICFAFNMFYSFEAKKKLTALLQEQSIDVAFVHNIYHHISPSIFSVLKQRNIPVVMMLHDYKLLSPNYSLFHHGAVHEEDARGWYWTCVRNRGFKNSWLQSLLVTLEMIWHHKIMCYYERSVDLFVTPSQFMRDLCVRFGWSKDRFVTLPLPINMNNFSVHIEDAGYVAYVGRLSEEKGLNVLLQAAALTPEIAYRIVGEGPQQRELKEQVAALGLRNVVFAGFKTGDGLKSEIAGACLLVLPALWYENYPLSVLEAKAMGKPVVASLIGGLPEMLPEDCLVPPGDAVALATAIRYWHQLPVIERVARGQQLRREVEENNSLSTHIKKLEEIFNGFYEKKS